MERGRSDLGGKRAKRLSLRILGRFCRLGCGRHYISFWAIILSQFENIYVYYIYIYIFFKYISCSTCSLVFSVAPPVVYTVSPAVDLLDPTGEAERVQASGVAADQLQTLEDEEFFVGVNFYQNTREHGLNLAMFGIFWGGMLGDGCVK